MWSIRRGVHQGTWLIKCKQIYDTLVVTYEGTSQVKRSKFNLLTRKYELFSMEEGKDIKVCLDTFKPFLMH